MNKQSKRWAFTLNNYSPEDEKILQGSMNSIFSYLIYGKEVGPTSGTPHLQGYFEVSKKRRGSAIKRDIGVTAMRLSTARRSAEVNSTYCSKDNVAFEDGCKMKQGERRDLLLIKEDIEKGKSLDYIWNEHFTNMIRYRNGLLSYYTRTKAKQFREPPMVYILHGPTGTGKTYRAYNHDPESFWVYPGKGWFDGYEGQHVAIFDEFDGSDLDFAQFKRITDRYPISVPVKGAYTPWCPKVIYFTSNIRPMHWWGEERKSEGWWDQLTRRVTTENIILMKDPLIIN